MEHVPDCEIQRLAAEYGCDSLEASVLADLKEQRSRDKQVSVYRIGDFYSIGSPPDAATEIRMAAAYERAKCNRDY
jgi:hypothetical protein